MAQSTRKHSKGKKPRRIPDTAAQFFPFNPYQSVEEVMADGSSNGQAFAAMTSRPSLLLKGLIPSTVRAQIAQCYQYAGRETRGASDLITSAVFVKKNFYAAGFQATPIPLDEEAELDAEEKLAFNELLESVRMRQTADMLFEDGIICDNMVLLGRHYKGSVWLCAARPDSVVYHNDANKESLFLDVSGLENLKRSDPKRWAQLPEDVKKAAESKEKLLPCLKEEGYFFVVWTNGRNFEGLCPPRMISYFYDIEMRECIKSGDFSNAAHLKRTILHYKYGETVLGAMNTLIVNRLAKDDKLQAILGALKSTSQTLVIGTEHTGQFQYITLDVKVFGEEKYAAVEKRILRWGFVNYPLLDGAGGNFASSLMGRDPMFAEGRRLQEAVSWMISRALGKMAALGVKGVPKQTEFVVTFDRQGLKDPNVLLKEWDFLYRNNLIDHQTLIEEGGRNYRLMRRRFAALNADNNKAGYGKPQQKTGGGQTGRPTESNTGKPQGGVRPSTASEEMSDEQLIELFKKRIGANGYGKHEEEFLTYDQ